MANRRGKTDKLQVQVAFRVRVPRGKKVSPRVFQQAIDRMIHGEDLPPGIEVRGIFWRNPNRKGDLSHWRYHSGADLSAAPTNAPLESAPRGSLQEAVDTLSGALFSGVITF